MSTLKGYKSLQAFMRGERCCPFCGNKNLIAMDSLKRYFRCGPCYYKSQRKHKPTPVPTKQKIIRETGKCPVCNSTEFISRQYLNKKNNTRYEQLNCKKCANIEAARKRRKAGIKKRPVSSSNFIKKEGYCKTCSSEDIYENSKGEMVCRPCQRTYDTVRRHKLFGIPSQSAQDFIRKNGYCPICRHLDFWYDCQYKKPQAHCRKCEVVKKKKESENLTDGFVKQLIRAQISQQTGLARRDVTVPPSAIVLKRVLLKLRRSL